MVQKTSLLALVVGLLVASSFVGAAAFTSANVQRDVTVGIEADDTAIVGLEPGTTDAATLNADSQLEIDPERSDTSFNGLNQDASFTYGDASSATAAEGSNAFTITNNDDVNHDFTLGYTQSQGSATLTYTVAYDTSGDGTADTTATFSSGSSTTITLNSGTTAYVVVEVDTGTGTTNVQGTLTVDAV